MNCKISFLMAISIAFAFSFDEVNGRTHNCDRSNLTGSELPSGTSFNSYSSLSTGTACENTSSSEAQEKGAKIKVVGAGHSDDSEALKSRNPTRAMMELRSTHWSTSHGTEPEEHLIAKDFARLQTVHRKLMQTKNQSNVLRLKFSKMKPAYSGDRVSGLLVSSLISGIAMGFEGYLAVVSLGTPPRSFSLILDTASDLTWIKSARCSDCPEQNGSHYDPKDSTSFINIICRDPRCQDSHIQQPCKADNEACHYSYFYGDGSNTTGDFALETFTFNLTASTGNSEHVRVENVMLGCSHRNLGPFNGASGVLGLGRGPLSLAAQLESLYGHSFSYCLVDRNRDPNSISKLIFGEVKGLLSLNPPNMNFTSLVGAQESPDGTYYYLKIRSVMVGGEVLDIPHETWEASLGTYGGTIIDSGASLTYFVEPAYEMILKAFVTKLSGYRMVENEAFYPCYYVSGEEKPEMPGFGIEFADGAVWNFPVENYFIPVTSDGTACLAMMGNYNHHGFSVIGNYLQQNFQMVFDRKKSRLGYAPTRCAGF